LKIAINASPAEIAVIKELLSPWQFSYVSSDEAEVSISYGAEYERNDGSIIVPSHRQNHIESNMGSKPEFSGNKRRIRVSVDGNSVLEITPKIFHFDSKFDKKAFGNVTSSSNELEGGLSSIDVVSEYCGKINKTLNAKQSRSFHALTEIPIPYNIIPGGLRKQLLRKRSDKKSVNLNDKLSIDALRLILVEAVERVAKRSLRKKLWDGKKYSVLLTHDVETRKGLAKARLMKKLEERCDLPSAWFIPSKCYKLEPQIIQDLANHGEIGSHDTRHDGKLAALPEQKMVKRIIEAKLALEKITRKPVKGFRAPLLQHNANLIAALRESNYVYDSSIPTWEPNHPSTMKPHGIETVFPLTINGLTEIPITLPQDHQLLYVLGLKPDEVVKEWLKATALIKSLGGLCTFLVHPDYALADGKMEAYEELLNVLASDKDASIVLPIEVARKIENS
jgi:peptidoglycan/xylan/chitin deacetylase (PgdA/CDA1 family)